MSSEGRDEKDSRTSAKLQSPDKVWRCTVTINQDAGGIYTVQIADVTPSELPWAVERRGEIVWRETP